MYNNIYLFSHLKYCYTEICFSQFNLEIVLHLVTSTITVFFLNEINDVRLLIRTEFNRPEKI